MSESPTSADASSTDPATPVSGTPSPAKLLKGIELDGGWKIDRHLERDSAIQTGGHFSEGYEVSKDDGTKAYLKALDYTKILRISGSGGIDQLKVAVDQFQFERDLMAGLSRNRRLSRVVTVLDHGDIIVEGDHSIPRVDYLIFEMADGDVRRFLAFNRNLDAAWKLHCLHHVAVGISQLHSVGVAHQDLKPSNVLVFDDGNIAKVGDLGRASQQGRDGPFDELKVAGQIGYAPPELLYGYVPTEFTVRRYACDLYHLGSMVFFFFGGNINATTALFNNMPVMESPIARAGGWDGTFQEVLPYLQRAFSSVIEQLRIGLDSELGHDISRELCNATAQLTNPDPSLRGHPKDHSKTGNSYSVQRYVSLLDRLAKKMEIRLKHQLNND